MPDSNFNSGFLQEAFRLREQNFDKYGDPNLYTDQQIRQNQATLGSIQLQGAYQQNQMQQLQAMKQMQDIQRSGEEERIKSILYPIDDGRGGTFFANLRQMEGIKTAKAIGDQNIASVNLGAQQQKIALDTAAQIDQQLAAKEGMPKLMDFKDRLAHLVSRVKVGGEDGAIAYKELDTLLPDKSISQFTDATGALRGSVELSSAAEKALDQARNEARATDLYQSKEATKKSFSDARTNLDSVFKYAKYMDKDEFREAFVLKHKIDKYYQNMDHTKPDPEEIGQLVYESLQFDPETFKRRQMASEGVQYSTEAGLKPSKITTGPKGVEVEAAAPTGVSSGESLTGRLVIEDKKSLDDLQKNISETTAQLAALKASGKPTLTDPKTQVAVTEKELDAKLSSYENDYVDKLNSNPNLPKTVGYERIMAAKGNRSNPSGQVPNVISGTPPPKQQPQQTAPPKESSAPQKSKAPTSTFRYVRQADGTVVAVEAEQNAAAPVKPRAKEQTNDLGPTKGKILYSPSGFSNPNDVKIVNDPDLQVKDGKVFRKVTTRKGVKLVDVTLEGYGVG